MIQSCSKGECGTASGAFAPASLYRDLRTSFFQCFIVRFQQLKRISELERTTCPSFRSMLMLFI